MLKNKRTVFVKFKSILTCFASTAFPVGRHFLDQFWTLQKYVVKWNLFHFLKNIDIGQQLPYINKHGAALHDQLIIFPQHRNISRSNNCVQQTVFLASVTSIDILYTLDSASNYSAIQKLKLSQIVPMKWEDSYVFYFLNREHKHNKLNLFQIRF
jgi:hypothetical protein